MELNENMIKKMTIGDVLDNSIDVYKRNFKKLTLLALIFYVPFMFLYTFLVSYLSADLINIADINDIDSVGNSSGYLYSILAYYASLCILGIIHFAYSITIKAVMEAAITKTVYDDITGNMGKSIKKIIKESFSRFSALFVNKILYKLIIFGISMALVIGLYILMIVALIGFGAAFSWRTGSSGLGEIIIGIVIAIVLVLIFAVVGLLIGYFYVKFIFGTQAIIIENKTAVQGISRSSELTKNNFWHIGLTLAFGALLFYFIPQIINTGAYALMFVNRSLYVAAFTFSQILSSIIYPFIITLMTVAFINLKIKKEGFDLELKVDTLLEQQKRENNIDINGETANA